MSLDQPDQRQAKAQEESDDDFAELLEAKSVQSE